MEDEERKFWDLSHARENYAAFYSKIDHYFTEEKLTDVSITCRDNRKFECHRLVLAAASEYFEKMFTGSWKESRTEVVVLHDVDGAIFEPVVQFAYKGTVRVDNESVYRLLFASDRFGIPTLEGWCTRYLIERDIPIEYALDIFSFACLTHKHSLIPSVSRFILDHLEQIHGNEDGDGEGLLKITFDDMKILLTYWRPSSSRRENQLFKVLTHWVCHSGQSPPSDKKAFLAQLKRTFGLQNISEDFIEQRFAENPRVHSDAVSNLDSTGVLGSASKSLALNMYVRSSADTCNLFTMKTFKNGVHWYPPKAIRDAVGKMKTVVIDDRLYSYSLQMESNQRNLVAFSAYSSVTLSDKQSLQIPSDLLENPHQGYNPQDFDAVSICGDPISARIYLRHHFTCQLMTNLFLYNCEIDKWFPIVNNNNNAIEMNILTCFDSRLYAFGPDNIAQAYDHRAGKWEQLANAKWSHGFWDRCCCHKDKIYVSCEMERSKHSIEGFQVLLEVYDPVAGRWSEIAPTPVPQRISFLGWLVSFENKLWMLGEDDDVVLQSSPIATYDYYVQRYDPFLQKWDEPYGLSDEKTSCIIDVIVF